MTSLKESSYPLQPLRIAVAQAAAASGDIPENVRRATAMIGEAARGGARLAVFPEKYLTGYVPEIIVTDPELYALSPGTSGWSRSGKPAGSTGSPPSSGRRPGKAMICTSLQS